MYLYSMIFIMVVILFCAFILGLNYARRQVTNELLNGQKPRLPAKPLAGNGVFVLIILIVGGGIGISVLYYLSQIANQHSASAAKSEAGKVSPRQVLYWIDPMEPNIHYQKPGTSPMGMTLEPVYAKDGNDELPANTIKLPAAYVDNLGVKTTPVVSTNSAANGFSAYGSIESDETRISYVTSYANGWVRNLLAKTTQMTVKKGQLLAQIYSPTLVNAENEYLTALQSKNELLIAAARDKLIALHIDSRQITAIDKTGQVSQLIDIYAPQDGIISALNIRQGDYITPDSKLFTIVDLSQVWLIANVFAANANQLKIGSAANATFDGINNRVWSGKVDYIYPEVDSATRTVRVRVVLKNPDLALKPNLYGNVQFGAVNADAKLIAPTSAIIMSSRGNKVLVARESGEFQVRSITTGGEIGDNTVVLSGLAIGERVVTEGEFMLDSEANLNAGLARIDSSATAPAGESSAMAAMPGMDMHGMEMKPAEMNHAAMKMNSDQKPMGHDKAHASPAHKKPAKTMNMDHGKMNMSSAKMDMGNMQMNGDMDMNHGAMGGHDD